MFSWAQFLYRFAQDHSETSPRTGEDFNLGTNGVNNAFKYGRVSISMFVTVACHHESYFTSLHLAPYHQNILIQQEANFSHCPKATEIDVTSSEVSIFLLQFLGTCLKDGLHSSPYQKFCSGTWFQELRSCLA